MEAGRRRARGVLAGSSHGLKRGLLCRRPVFCTGVVAIAKRAVAVSFVSLVLLLALRDGAQAGGPASHFMPAGFVSYASPSLRAEMVAMHPPQTLVMAEVRPDGWALVYTPSGDAWVNISSSSFALQRVYGLHDYFGQQSYERTISPQTVEMLDARDGWLQIATAQGPKWVNLSFEPDPSPLAELMGEFGSNFAMLYMDLLSGYAFMHNPDRIFNAASVNKLQHALYVYALAERGELDMGRVHTLRDSDRRSGTGGLQHRAEGSAFTTRELLRESMRVSDNTAHQMLTRLYGLPGYRDFAREIGASDHDEIIRNVSHSRITARDAGAWAAAVHAYLVSGGTYSQEFRDNLMNANMQLITSSYPLGNKYGWFETFFHDFAIVFANRPYALVILSDMPDASFDAFRRISRGVEEFHRAYFP